MTWNCVRADRRVIFKTPLNWLENNAKMTSMTVDYDGRTIKGTEIKITPYRHDPHRDALQQYAGKYYVFTLS
jgi:hypothetical protein